MTTLTAVVFALGLQTSLEGGFGVFFDFDPTGNHFGLRKLSGLQEAHERHRVNDVKVNGRDRSSEAARLRNFNFSNQSFSSGLETQIHNMPALFASASEPLTPKGQQPSDQRGGDRTDRAGDRDDESYVFALHVILVAGLSGLIVSLLICVPIGFLMWWLDHSKKLIVRGS
jgi:hypothetical protein